MLRDRHQPSAGKPPEPSPQEDYPPVQSRISANTSWKHRCLPQFSKLHTLPFLSCQKGLGLLRALRVCEGEASPALGSGTRSIPYPTDHQQLPGEPGEQQGLLLSITKTIFPSICPLAGPQCAFIARSALHGPSSQEKNYSQRLFHVVNLAWKLLYEVFFNIQNLHTHTR